jgi:hypothetical protein
MNKNEIQAGTTADKCTAADNSTSASLEQNGLLSAALSVEEGNKLIAKFMDLEYFINHEGTHFVFKKDKTLPYLIPRYHQSWDWLMPVVEAIEMLHWNDRNNQFNPPLEFFLQNEIEFVWNHVVKFLKWYNLNAVPVGSR